MTTTAQKLLTTEEFYRLPEPLDGCRQELVRGEVVTTPPPGFEHGDVQLTVEIVLRQFVRAHQLGRVTVETGTVTERGPDSVRGPDVSYWSVETLPLDKRPRGYPDLPPDLCVEGLSPSNRPGAMNEKLREYFRRGVRMVWFVDPSNRTAVVYRSPDQGLLLHEEAALSGEDVLPGFQCRVAELFD